MLRLCNTKEFLSLPEKSKEGIEGYGQEDTIVQLLKSILLSKIESIDSQLESKDNHELPSCDHRLSYLLGQRKELKQIYKLLMESDQAG